MKYVAEIIVAAFMAVLIIGCCCPSDSSVPKADRFEILSDQKVQSERHSNFSIMIIKDKKTDKEFKVIYNSTWGVVKED